MANFEKIKSIPELKIALQNAARVNKGSKAFHGKFKRDHIAPGHNGKSSTTLALMVADWRRNRVSQSTLLTDLSLINYAHLEIENWINKAPDENFVRENGGWTISKSGSVVRSLYPYSFFTIDDIESLSRELRKDDSAQRSAIRKYTTDSTGYLGIACTIEDEQILIYHVDW